MQRVGCDWIVDSNTTEDQCGVCGGTGENCTTIKMEFNKKMNTSDGYFEIATLPMGSRHILIEEMHPTKNFLSIGKANSNETFLNGNRLILMPGEFAIEKITGLYERENEREKIRIPGPIPFDITINVSLTSSTSYVNASFIIFSLIRCWFEAKTKIQAFDMNTHSHQMTLDLQRTTGSWAIGPPVPRLAAAVCNNV